MVYSTVCALDEDHPDSAAAAFGNTLSKPLSIPTTGHYTPFQGKKHLPFHTTCSSCHQEIYPLLYLLTWIAGMGKRMAGGEVNSCICSMQSRCCSRWEGGRERRREAELGEIQCWYIRMLNSVQTLLQDGVVVETLVERRPVCRKPIRLKNLFSHSDSVGCWNNHPCFQKDAAQ